MAKSELKNYNDDYVEYIQKGMGINNFDYRSNESVSLGKSTILTRTPKFDISNTKIYGMINHNEEETYYSRINDLR